MLLTRQFRVPIGDFLLETPAGMMDEDGNFLGIAAKVCFLNLLFIFLIY